MLIYLSVLIGISSLGILIAGLLAFLRNSKNPQNRWFLALSVALALWIPTNFIDSSIVKPGITDFFLLIDLAMAPFIAWTLLEFVEVFSVRSAVNHKRNRTYKLFLIGTLVLNIVFGAVSLAGLVVTSSVRDGILTIEYSSMFILYVALLISYFIYALARLVIKLRNSHGSEKAALSLIAWGIILALVTNIATNIIFPFLIDDRQTIKALNIIGYLGFLLSVLSVYVAITTQKLFDIRFVVARSLTYILSLGSIALIFVAVAYTATSGLFDNSLADNTTRLIYTVLAVILALLFPPLKKFFDRTTNRLFFRDAYDPQDLLDQFNQVLVSTYQVDVLLKKSVKIIERYLKPTYTVLGLKETDISPQRIAGTPGSPQFTNEDIAFVRSKTPHLNTKMIVVDLIGEKHEQLQNILQANNISLISRLTPAVHEEGAGYLILGPKKSGNLYSSQDLKVLEIISNQLVIAIQNVLRFEEIENFNLTLQEKITEATRKLRSTNEKLKQMDEAKDDFISMASHQLRTPLTSVKGYISMVLEEDAGKINATQREMLGQAFFSSQRMVYLIADLLNVSRLKTGKFIIDRTLVQLDQIVEQELRQLQETAAARSLTLEFESPKQFPPMMLDETKTRQIIMNFVDNAIYYTPAGGHIKVKLIDKPNTIELRVEDDGIGVPKAEQAHLFTKFYRAGNARQARPDGTGLGLFMAKKVIVAQGGSLVFESQEGVGSAFGFIFSKTLAATDSGPDVKELAVSPEPDV